ncbi:hypothetical protein C3B61_15330 [Cryobacterium zongtaii]|uniref:Uncharacterized protein n=1 Tax=Cryobacterium zongtaii TaxID=1259217 RepID=A0A2S3Z9N9_9MICO|nr:hypothetical protein [Cryobacterium zongtaii]POH62257.1 hypothetical protein C3B61_15330 [Cryobacterium zongtaii]
MSSIMARRTLAHRASTTECWPAGTVHTEDDLIINGASLVRTSSDQTPAVRIGPAGSLWAQQTPSPQRFITVLLTRVEETGFTDSHRRLVVWVDAELDRCRPILSAARVVGRRSVVHTKRMQLRPRPKDDMQWVWLPSDVAVGDLIAVPCEGTVPLSDARRHSRNPGRLGEERSDDPDDDLPLARACLK